MPVDSSVQHMAFLVSPMNDTIPLHPLVQLKANEVLLWDWLAREEHHVEMLNYSTGKIEIVPVTALEERDVHALWTMASQRMRS